MKESGMAVHELGKLGVYISIPFCRSKCTYCNFASGVYPARDHARYVRLGEIQKLHEFELCARAQANSA